MRCGGGVLRVRTSGHGRRGGRASADTTAGDSQLGDRSGSGGQAPDPPGARIERLNDQVGSDGTAGMAVVFS